jgi:hypothetical protein
VSDFDIFWLPLASFTNSSTHGGQQNWQWLAIYDPGELSWTVSVTGQMRSPDLVSCRATTSLPLNFLRVVTFTVGFSDKVAASVYSAYPARQDTAFFGGWQTGGHSLPDGAAVCVKPTREPPPLIRCSGS